MKPNLKLLNNYSPKDFTMKLKLPLQKKRRSCLSLVLIIHKLIWILKLVKREKKIIQKAESFLNFSRIKFQKQQKISDLYQQVIIKKD